MIGRLDVALAASDNDSIVVLLGNGDGTLEHPTAYSTGIASNPVFVAVADLNDDHHLDLVNANSDKSNVGVFFGRGDGTFSPRILLSSGAGGAPLSMAVGDVNNDRYLDMVVANSFTNNVGVLLGKGGGTFEGPLLVFNWRI